MLEKLAHPTHVKLLWEPLLILLKRLVASDVLSLN